MNDFPRYEDNPSGKKPRRNIWSYLSVGLAGILIGCVVLLAVNPGGSVRPIEATQTPGVQQTLPPEPGTTPSNPSGAGAADNTSLEQLMSQLSNTAALPEYSDGAIIYERMSPSLVTVTTKEKSFDSWLGVREYDAGEGSGVIISADGYLITNHHVIEGASSVTVILASGESHPATVVGSDSGVDIALLKVEAEGLIPATLGDSSTLKVGKTVYAMGNPLGSQFYASMTDGIISGLDRNIDQYDTALIQSNAAINPGSSGGPLVNTSGEVVGICTMRLVSNTSVNTEGMSFFIPINSAKTVVENILSGKTQGGEDTSEALRPRLGVSVRNVFGFDSGSNSRAQYPTGCLIVIIEEGSPAERSDLQMYDIITEINGQRVMNFDEMSVELNKNEVGKPFTIKVFRDGEYVEVTAELALLGA